MRNVEIFNTNPKSIDALNSLDNGVFAPLIQYINCLELAKIPGKKILEYHQDILKNSFSLSGIPVFICAYNEEDDLPRLLLALASSSINTRPIIIDNGSKDDTLLIPKALGIESVSESKPGLINARIAAFQYWKQEMPNSKIALGLDADCIPTPTWAKTLTTNLSHTDKTGGVVYGSFWYYGGSILSDGLLSCLYIAKNCIQNNLKHSIMTHGGNFGIRRDDKGKILDNLCEMDRSITIGNGYAIKQAVLNGGGTVRRNYAHESLAFTRSDRFPDLFRVLNLLVLRHHAVRQAYDDWYLNERGGGVDGCEGK